MHACMPSRFSCVRLSATLWTGSPVPGILQARTLEWVAISFSPGKQEVLCNETYYHN